MKNEEGSVKNGEKGTQMQTVGVPLVSTQKQNGQYQPRGNHKGLPLRWAKNNPRHRLMKKQCRMAILHSSLFTLHLMSPTGPPPSPVLSSPAIG